MGTKGSRKKKDPNFKPQSNFPALLTLGMSNDKYGKKDFKNQGIL